MGKENLVQGAIAASLEVYCDRHNLHTDAFAPYANQQGIQPGRYIADLLMQIAYSKLLLLEIKELSAPSGTLPAYNPLQHYYDWQMEALGVPILYGYAAVKDLCYFAEARGKDWPLKTLFHVNVCPPSTLLPIGASTQPAKPNTSAHSNLLTWLLSDPSPTHQLVTIAALLNLPASALANEQLLLVATGAHAMQAMPATGVVTIVREFLETPEPFMLDTVAPHSPIRHILRAWRDELQAAVKAQGEELRQKRQEEIEAPADAAMQKPDARDLSGPEKEARREKERKDAARQTIVKKLAAKPSTSEPNGDPRT